MGVVILWSFLIGILSASQAFGDPSAAGVDAGEAFISPGVTSEGSEILEKTPDPQFITLSENGPRDESIPFSVSGLEDLGDQVKFIFDWGDGTTSETGFVDSGVNVSGSHSWSSEGVYHVRVRAEDIHGASSDWSEALEVRIEQPNSPPETPDRPDGMVTGYNCVPHSYSTSATDPDGDMVKYIFDWGDGTISETSYIGPGTSVSLSHRWINPGTYYITAEAVDTEGETSGWSDAARILIYRPIKPS